MQNYQNHRRFYVPHHFIFYPLLMILIIGAIWYSFEDKAHHFIWIGFAVILLIIGWLSFMLRQHYALGLQNRLVVMEMRYRYHLLTGGRLEAVEQRLQFGQIAALRFASDEELPELLSRCLEEGLSADGIKRSIKRWKPDHDRV